MKKIILILAFILFLPLNSFAEQVCFDEAVASQMVVRLEQAKIAEEQLANQAGSNIELQNQLAILRATIALYEEQTATYKNLRTMDQTMSAAKDKACQAEVKAATPTFMDKLKTNIMAGGVGAVLAVIAILALHL